MRGARSRRGRSSTTRSVRIAVWDTARRKSLPRRRRRPSTQLSERQGTQTPSLAPRAPPSRLKPKMEQQKVVVFLRERKQGAGHWESEDADKMEYGPRFHFFAEVVPNNPPFHCDSNKNRERKPRQCMFPGDGAIIQSSNICL